MGSLSTNASLFSRALVLDGAGSPTTITVLSTEALDVTYQINVYPDLTDHAGSMTLSGTTYTTNVRASNVNSISSWSFVSGGSSGDVGGVNSVSAYSTQTLGATTATPAGTVYSSSASNIYLSYTNGNYYRDTQINFGLTDLNAAGGIGSVVIQCGSSAGAMGKFQVSFTPVIPKDATHVMTWYIRHSWARGP